MEELTNSGDDVTQCFLHVPDHSYIRAKFTSDDKTVGGFVELGFGATSKDASTLARRHQRVSPLCLRLVEGG